MSNSVGKLPFVGRSDENSGSGGERESNERRESGVQGGGSSASDGEGREIRSDGGTDLGGRDSADESIDISAVAMLNTLPRPAFLLDANHQVIGWNEELAELTGVEAASVLGERDSGRFYGVDEKTETLADAVVSDPENAHRTTDAERSGRDQRAYELDEVLVNDDGQELRVQSVATPIYEDGAFAGVIQLVNDVTEKIERQEAMRALVRQSAETGDELTDGNLDARVEFTGNNEVLDEEVLELVNVINDVAESTQEMVSGFVTEVNGVSESAAEIAESAVEVDEQVDTQNESIEQIAEEMEELSTTMEEVAATSDQVASAAEQAREAAGDGMDANESARDTVDDVRSVAEELADTVDELNDRMDAVGEVVEVIAEIAEQTDMLALNASIEAARADVDGSGFEVVADEVKSLANETKEHTDEIAAQIDELREQTIATVEATETTTEYVRRADDEIDDAVESLAAIDDAVEEVATGIDQVARATDDQAASIEESTATATDVLTDAQEIADAVGEITAETAEQRDAVDDIVDYMSELAGSDALDRVDDDIDAVETARDEVDEATL